MTGARPSGDAAIVAAAIELEQTAAAVYDAAAAGGLLDPRTRRLALLFRDHERAHAGDLTAALAALGGAAPARRVHDAVDRLAELDSQAAVLGFAIELERTAVAAYHDAVGRLRDPRLAARAAQIMANQGQHLAVLRPLVNREPIPTAFERGGVE